MWAAGSRFSNKNENTHISFMKQSIKSHSVEGFLKFYKATYSNRVKLTISGLRLIKSTREDSDMFFQ